MDISMEMISGAIAAMAGALAWVYKATWAKLEDCEKDREDLWRNQGELGCRIATLEAIQGIQEKSNDNEGE